MNMVATHSLFPALMLFLRSPVNDQLNQRLNDWERKMNPWKTLNEVSFQLSNDFGWNLAVFQVKELHWQEKTAWNLKQHLTVDLAAVELRVVSLDYADCYFPLYREKCLKL